MRSIIIILVTSFSFCHSTFAQWKDLIADGTLEQWHIFQNEDGEKSGWVLEDDVLVFNGVSDMESGKGDASLLSNKEYESFEIKFEWRVEKGGNSGFMWAVQEDEKYKYPYQTGQEIQILDPAIYDEPEIILGGEIELKNAAEDLTARKHFLGALYDLKAPFILNAARPVAEWNAYRISIDYGVNEGKVWLNDTLINTFPLHGPEWQALFKESKFSRSAEFPYLGDERWYGFAMKRKGSICLQDHPGRAEFRNIRIREL